MLYTEWIYPNAVLRRIVWTAYNCISHDGKPQPLMESQNFLLAYCTYFHKSFMVWVEWAVEWEEYRWKMVEKVAIWAHLTEQHHWEPQKRSNDPRMVIEWPYNGHILTGQFSDDYIVFLNLLNHCEPSF